jgi:hypothetical protein
MTKKILLVTCMSLAGMLSLSGCGMEDNEKWEVIEYEGVPYTDERTAGRGVKYVLAALAPKKGPVLEPIMDTTPVPQEPMALPVAEPEPEPVIRNATPIFNEKMGKSK